MMLRRLQIGWFALACMAVSPLALAQDEGAGSATVALPPDAALPPAPPGGGVTVVQVPANPQPMSGGSTPPDVNAHLPSSAQVSTDTSSAADHFDLGRYARGGPSTVRGSDKGSYIVSGSNAPELHTVKRGETLWGIAGRYYGNHYAWPRVWSYNTQVQNPHWLYPGDHLRLRSGPGVKTVGGFVYKKPLVPPGTVFQMHTGYVLDGDPQPDDWGQVIGSPDDQMLLSEGDHAYIKLKEDRDVQVGQHLTLWEEREVKGRTEHPLVWIRGIARVDRYNRKTHTVRAKIVESLTVIERGIRVGPLDTKVDTVEPVTNESTIKAHVVGALYPYEFYGQHQIVFIDKGDEDGVRVGNRFFAVSRADEWRRTLRTGGNMADKRAITEDDRMARVETTPDTDEPEIYPAETYAELRVLRVRNHTATCIITASVHEMPRGAFIIARQGY